MAKKNIGSHLIVEGSNKTFLLGSKKYELLMIITKEESDLNAGRFDKFVINIDSNFHSISLDHHFDIPNIIEWISFNISKKWSFFGSPDKM